MWNSLLRYSRPLAATPCCCSRSLLLLIVRSVVVACWVQGMQGRFSGRLGTKEDEKRLAAECRLVGPLLGGTSRGEKSLPTLAKLVRAIAAGSVRAHLEAKEAELQVGAAWLAAAAAAAAAGTRAAMTAGQRWIVALDMGCTAQDILPQCAMLQPADA